MKRWGMAMNGWGRAGELSFSCFTVSKEVPWQALGSLMYSRENEHRAHPRWDLVDLLGGVGSDPSSGEWFSCSELWGCLEHLEALQRALSADLPAAGKDPQCLACSALVILHSSPVSVPPTWDCPGDPFDISWVLFTVNIKSLVLTKALPAVFVFVGAETVKKMQVPVAVGSHIVFIYVSLW